MVLTITSPSESLLNELRTVEVGPYCVFIVVADILACNVLETDFLVNILPWLVKNLQMLPAIKMNLVQFQSLITSLVVE